MDMNERDYANIAIENKIKNKNLLTEKIYSEKYLEELFGFTINEKLISKYYVK